MSVKDLARNNFPVWSTDQSRLAALLSPYLRLCKPPTEAVTLRLRKRLASQAPPVKRDRGPHSKPGSYSGPNP